MGLRDFFKKAEKTAGDWFCEAQGASRAAGKKLIEAAARDSERIRRGETGNSKDGEHARISREIDERITQYLEKALQIDSSYAPALFALGERENNIDSAIHLFDRAIAANQTFGSAYFCKAKALERKGALDEAIICYDKAIEFNPNDAEALMGKSRLLSQKGNEKEAALYAEKAKTLDPTLGNAFRLEKFRWRELPT
jgi:tetratricopeptide (TPR) repeat protein